MKSRPLPPKTDRVSRSYKSFEYKHDSHPLQTEQQESANEYILTGRNPIREALKNHHDLEKLLLSGEFDSQYLLLI